MTVLSNKCAAGLPNMIRLSPEQFRPRKPKLHFDGNITAMCHLCDQETMVKIRKPRQGFFVEHDSSQAAYRPVGSKGVTAPRERKRRK